MVRSLSVVRIGTPFKQQPCQFWMPRNASCAIHRALPRRTWLMLRFHPSCICIRSRIQQRFRRRNEALGPRAFKPQVSRETQMRQRVPAIRTALPGRALRIPPEKTPDLRRIAKNGRRVNVLTSHFRMRGQNRLGPLERPRAMPRVARNTSRLNPRGNWILDGSRKAPLGQRFDVAGKLRPALKSMFARNHKLRIRQPEFRARNFIAGQSGKSRMLFLDAFYGFRIYRFGIRGFRGLPGPEEFDQLFRLFLVLLEARASR